MLRGAIAHFTHHDVVAALVNTIAQAATDPHSRERRALVEVSAPLAGASAVSGGFWRFSRTPAVVVSTHMVGEHNEAVLTGLLGYSEDEAQAIAMMTLNGQAIASGAEVEAPLKYRGNETTIVVTPPEPPPDETTGSETTDETVEEATCARGERRDESRAPTR